MFDKIYVSQHKFLHKNIPRSPSMIGNKQGCIINLFFLQTVTNKKQLSNMDHNLSPEQFPRSECYTVKYQANA